MHTYLIKNTGKLPVVLIVDGIEVRIRPHEFFECSGLGTVERPPMIRYSVRIGNTDYWEVNAAQVQDRVPWLKEGF